MIIKKKTKIIIFIIIAPVLLFLLLIIYNGIKLKNGDLIKWEGRLYTKKEFEKVLPPQNYHVDAKNTPEEVYEGFRQAILDDNIEKALGFIIKEKKEFFKERLNNSKTKQLYKEIPNIQNLKKDNDTSYENIAIYRYFKKDNEIIYSVYFIKTPKGYWKIENI